MLQSLLHVLWSSCHAESIRAWDAARARLWDSADSGCSAQQFAIRRRLLQEVGVILGETTGFAHWDLQKFYTSIDGRHLLRLGAERISQKGGGGGSPGPFCSEGLAMGWRVCQTSDGGHQHLSW